MIIQTKHKTPNSQLTSYHISLAQIYFHTTTPQSIEPRATAHISFNTDTSLCAFLGPAADCAKRSESQVPDGRYVLSQTR
jgi:hypothetical protein